MHTYTKEDISHAITASGLSIAQAKQLQDALWEVIGRELSVGEEVEVPDLGHFFTVKYPSETGPDGNVSATYIEPEFEPNPDLKKLVEKAMHDQPELFSAEAPADDADEEGEEKEEKEDKEDREVKEAKGDKVARVVRDNVAPVA